MTNGPDSVFGPAAERWRRSIEALPERVDRCQAPIDTCSPVFEQWAREVLPPRGGSVLDVGCSGGHRALALVPPANEIVGVDHRGAELDRFVAAASAAGVARRTVHGSWPDVAPFAPPADVVVCGRSVYSVPDVAPFLLALTARARLAVVLEIPARHPVEAWRACVEEIGNVTLPATPTADELAAVLDELGFDAERGTSAVESSLAEAGADVVDVVCRCLGLGAGRSDDVARWLEAHPLASSEPTVVLRWPGAAEPE